MSKYSYCFLENPQEFGFCFDFIRKNFNEEYGYELKIPDEFYPFSTYFVAFLDDEPILVLRIIFANHLGFPCEQYLPDGKKVEKKYIAEVSRMCMAKPARNPYLMRRFSNYIFKYLKEKHSPKGEIILQATNKSKAIYTRIGFKVCSDFFFDPTVDDSHESNSVLMAASLDSLIEKNAPYEIPAQRVLSTYKK